MGSTGYSILLAVLSDSSGLLFHAAIGFLWTGENNSQRETPRPTASPSDAV